jgi:uncharacterized membrane protein
MPYLLTLHLLAAVVWVGGMFFAYLALRPAAGPLEPPLRLALWRRVFARFFPWVGAAVVVLPATGYVLIVLELGGFAAAGLHTHIMQGTGWLMILLFAHLIAGPYRRLRRALDGNELPTAAKALNQIRRIILVNLLLGLATVIVGGSGRFWS